MATVALRFGEGITSVGSVNDVGQISFFGLEEAQDGTPITRDGQNIVAPTSPTSFDFGEFFGAGSAVPDKNASRRASPQEVVGSIGSHHYPLRAGMPRRFKTQIVSAQNDVTEEDCAQLFMISTRDLFEVMKNNVPVEKRTIEVFSHEIQREFNFAADLSPAHAAEAAQRALFRNKTFDPRELRRTLLRKVEMVMRDETMSEANDLIRVAHFLNVILATHPELLYEAQKAALAKHAEILEAAELPNEIVWPEPLPKSPRNIYGVMPAKPNTWEKPFAELLDYDANNVVTWWHRNEPRQPWSVNVLMPDGRGFYPDFVIGIEGRKTEEGVLLADPKLSSVSSAMTRRGKYWQNTASMAV